MNTQPADIFLAQYCIRRVVFLNGRRYVVSWQTKDGVNKYYLTITGEREGIDPTTKYDAQPTPRYFRVDVNPTGRLGKKIMQQVLTAEVTAA